MSRGNDRYEFDYANKVITHYENNKRTESLYYDEDLDDPRIWDVEHIGAKVKEYEYGNLGGLWRVKYWGKYGDIYMPLTINEKGEENRAWELLRVNKNAGRETKVVNVEHDYYTGNYVIGELDETTGLYNEVAVFADEDKVKQYLFKHYLGW